MKLKTFLAPLTLAALITAPSFAGERGGNGGDGIEIDGKLYVLDLVEAGVEIGNLNPHHSDDLEGLEKLRVRLANRIPRSASEALALKLQRLQSASPVFAEVLLQAIELYNWRLVNSALVNIKDENTLLDYENLVQLAIRRNANILIDRTQWERLDAYNQSALILHEVIYALVKPIEGKQDSVAAREIVGHLYSRMGSQDDIKSAANGRLNFTFPAMRNWDIRVLGKEIAYNPKISIWSPSDEPLGSVDVSITPTSLQYATPRLEIFTREACEPARGLRRTRAVELRSLIRYEVAAVELKAFADGTMVEVHQTEKQLRENYSVLRTGEDCRQRIKGVFESNFRQTLSSFENY
jgi:hypothetical protein